MAFQLKYEVEQEEDGRWICAVLDLPGVMTYGQTRREAVSAAEALALRIIADRIQEQQSPLESFSF